MNSTIIMTEPGHVLERLSAEVRDRLDTLVSEAAELERSELERALNEILSVLPRLLRPAARKVLFGGSK